MKNRMTREKFVEVLVLAIFIFMTLVVVVSYRPPVSIEPVVTEVTAPRGSPVLIK